MKLIKLTVVALTTILTSQAYGAFQDVIATYDAIYNPSAKGQYNCDELVLGDRPDLFTEIEADGTVKVQLRIEEDRAGQPKFKFYVNTKAFRDYFTNEIVPVSPAELFVKTSADSIFPNINPKLSRDWRLWNRTGYVRQLTSVDESGENFTAGDLMQLLPTLNKYTEDDIIDIRSSDISINSTKIVLTVEKKFKNSNPDVPKWMKSASWIESRDCHFTLIK